MTTQYSVIGEYNVTVYCENGLGNDQIVIKATILGPIVEAVFADPVDPITVVKTNDDQHVAVQVEGLLMSLFDDIGCLLWILRSTYFSFIVDTRFSEV